MRSKLLQIYDYRKVDLSAFDLSFTPNTEVIRREMRQLANRNASWEPTQRIQKGDMAVCRLTSANPRFQKEQIKLMVGQGLFHEELEERLVGLQAGEETEVSLPTEGTVVQVKVLSILHKEVPALTDAMIEKCMPLGAKTVKKFQRALCHRQLEQAVEEKAEEVVPCVLKQVHENSVIWITKEDWQCFVDNELERHRQLAALDGLTLEDMTPEQFEGRIPVSSYHELVTWTQRDAWDSIEQTLLGQHYARQDNALFAPERYEQFIKEFAENWRMPMAIARRINTREQYENGYYSSYYYGLVTAHVRRWLKESAQKKL